MSYLTSFSLQGSNPYFRLDIFKKCIFEKVVLTLWEIGFIVEHYFSI